MRGRVGGVVRGSGLALLALVALVMPVSGAGATATGVSATWQIQASPNVTVPSGQVQAVSCLPTGACTAVGYYLNAHGLYVPLAETWNGRSWQQRAAPSPAGAHVPGLNGVSCVSADFCEAVGISNELVWNGDTGFAEMWNGSSWRLQPFPSPAGATSIQLTAVSCASADFCEAVGDYINSSNAVRSLAVAWNGTGWKLQSTPNQAGSGPTSLEGVSCVSARFCQAVDFYGPMAEEWNGTSWTAHPVPIPSGMTSPDLSAVSCTSTSFCAAAGTYFDPSTSALVLFAERWNGSSWREQSVPGSAHWQILTSVSCVSAASCEAVGYKQVFVSGVDTFHAIADIWNGTSWHAQNVPSAGGTAPTMLAAVSCAAADACEAGGSFPARIDVWNGTSWAIQPAVVPRAATGNSLGGVSCVSATFCEAVGLSDAIPLGLAEVSNGGAWRIQSRSASTPLLTAVSCISATFCEAVGSARSTDGAAVWNGTSWQAQPTPGDEYTAVSCTSTTFCVAVGPGGAAMWNGTSWSPESLPVPAVSGFPYYSGVSCAAANACEAVGGGNAAFAAGWNGSSWTAQKVPGPAGATGASLTKVSCVAANSCEAVGRSTLGAYSAAWNGSTWTAQAVLPVPSGARSDTLTGLACTSASACTAVGYSAGSAPPYPRLTLAEAWDGTSWSIQSTLSPAPTHNELDGVSCVTAGPCVAVGSSPDAAGYSMTLVEATG